MQICLYMSENCSIFAVAMILYPNCKINLGLRVVRKRADGYHDLETIFVPIYGLHDELEVVPAPSFSFVQEGITVDCSAEDNLIFYIAELASPFPERRALLLCLCVIMKRIFTFFVNVRA